MNGCSRLTVVKKNSNSTKGRDYFNKEIRFYSLLKGHGITPNIVNQNEKELWFELEFGLPLVHHMFATEVHNRDRSEMRDKIVSQILKMHSLGVAHRDLHNRNVVVIGNEPRFIDFELSAEVEKGLDEKFSYDLYGPNQYIQPPPEHQRMGISVNWGTPKNQIRGLGVDYGDIR